MSSIQILSDHLASQIAAGEVVERPATVIKELVENSLDAGASQVTVELESGGKRRMTVTDDGSGMDSNDALLAFDRHATSKIRTIEDLETVASLGFRGEALASIAAVARVELKTAMEPGDGVRVRIEGGRVRSVQPLGTPKGTRLEVASLFWNVPARRKFLKTPATELRRCLEVVQGYALARPDVHFTVVHESRTLLDALPAGDGAEGAKTRIRQIFGADLAEGLGEIESPLAESARRIWGFIGDKNSVRGRRLFIFVNRRLIRDRAILATFYRSVREEWKGDDFPALFLFLDLPADEVDVNVHPQKSEVRFRDSGLLRRLEASLRLTLAGLRGEEHAPLSAPQGAPGAPLVWQGFGQSVGPAGVDASSNESPAGSRYWESPASDLGFDPALAGVAGSGGEIAESPPSDSVEGAWQPGFRGSFGVGSPSQRIADVAYAPMAPRQVPLSGRSGAVRPFRLLGQYKGTLLLLEGPDGLYLVDQHVAHERILYERFRQELEDEDAVSQQLVTPVLLELGPAEALRLVELGESLSALGFELRELSGDGLGLVSAPASLSVDQSVSVLMSLAASVERDIPLEELRARLLDDWAANRACKAAVKMHEPLGPDEMEALISELFVAEQPYACPHGRPIVLQMTDRELERRFGRR